MYFFMYIIFYFVTSSISIVPPFAFYIRLIPLATFSVKKGKSVQLID